MNRPYFTVAVLALAGFVACGQAATASNSATTGTGSAALRDAAVSPNAVANPNGWHQDPNTLGVQFILPMLHLVPHEAFAGMDPACDPNATHAQLNVCGKPQPGNAQATWNSCTPQHGPWGHHPGGDPNHGPHHAMTSSGQVSITASATPDPNTACDANTPIAVSRQATFSVSMGSPNDANGMHMQVSGNNSETVNQASGSNAQDVNLTLNENRTFTDPNGVAHQKTVSGTVRIQETRGDHQHGPGDRTIDGTLSVSGDTVVFTGVHQTAPHSCMWPTSGQVQRTGSDGTTHTLVFSSTCGQATLDGGAVTLPTFPMHHGHHHGPHGGPGGPGGFGPPPAP